MEEVAEGYLYELVNRSLLQVVERNESGRVRSCRMHDIIRLLALTKSNEESFCKVYDGLGSSSAENTRRLSVQSANIEQLTQSRELHVRSIYVFNNGLTIDSLKSFLKSFYLLSTLDLQGTQIMELPDEVFNLFNLRFLGLRNTEVRNIPSTVGRLQKLEVLDVYNAQLLTLPNSVATLKNLRYLHVATDPKKGVKGVVAWIGIQVPVGIRHLTGLQALQLVEASSDILCDLGALTELRTFAITKVQREQCADLCNAIMNMNHLVSLAIMAISEKETLQLEELYLPPTLAKLELGGQLDKKVMPQIVSSFSDLSNLTLLALAFSKLDEDAFSCLLALHGLRGLWLDKAYEGKRLHFDAMSFPKLHQLAISDAPHLNNVTVEQSALQSLVQLTLVDCPELKALPDGIEYLRTLEKLYLRGASKELTDQLQQKEPPHERNGNLNKIEHIQRVTVYP
uniref:Disease resistance protein RPM1 n=1 Tax=Arundo donax TaxID=35708 RepID=A0A0A8XWL9_ARUDO